MALTLFIGKIESQPDHPLNPVAKTLTDRVFHAPESCGGKPTESALDIIYRLLVAIEAGEAGACRTDDGSIWVSGDEEHHGSVWLRIHPSGEIELSEPAA